MRSAARHRRLGPAAAGALLLVSVWGIAHVRLVHPSNGAELRWGNPGSVSIVLQERGSDDLPPGGHLAALRAAISSWNAAPGSLARLIEDTSPSSQEREDWQSASIHSILFDETNASGYFPNGSGIVAITPVFFSGSGVITDADILFNGQGFRFTTSRVAGRFDVEDVAAHELGHLLGLDHTPFAGGTMYPYVDPSIILHRSLSLDDQRGVRDAYPAQSDGALRGLVQRADESPVSGAHLVLRDASGRPLAGTLSGADGVWRMRGLDAGVFDLYAAPLTGPVSAANLGVVQPIDTDFGATHLGSVGVSAGIEGDAGTAVLPGEVGIALGRVSDDFPKRVIQGSTVGLTVRGQGFDPSGTLSASDPALQVQNVVWTPVSVQFEVAVPAGAPTGHVDLEATNVLGERAILTAGLEITPPDPAVYEVFPASALATGGTTLSVSGSGFRAGLRVVIGDRIYVDGVPGGCTRVDSSTLWLTLGETLGGRHDVVVIDPSGVEGRLPDGFLAIAEPRIDSVFPSSGSAAGGTLVTVSGDSFAPGAVVTIDGVVQEQVSVESTDLLRLRTAGGNVGGPWVLAVENPGGESAAVGFSYVPKADPILHSVAPTSGSASGGESVTLNGTGFVPGLRVVFGADPSTGAGGRDATQVEFVDSTSVRVMTPKTGAGSQSVLVEDSATAQASLVDDAFTFVGSDDDGGGGCFGALTDVPADPRRVLANSGWMLALLALAAYRARRAASPRVACAS